MALECGLILFLSSLECIMSPFNNNEADTSETVFGKIVRGAIDADVVYRDELVTAFRDIQPRAPVHILVVPNKTISTCLLYTSPSPRDRTRSRMPSSA